MRPINDVLPMTNRIAQIAWGDILPMRPSVGRNDSEECAVHVIVKKHDLARVLDNFMGWLKPPALSE
ncbi:MAG: hypothetical protein DMG15_05705 [Acidobacteria bacterium]|nr:MAG: hypothetical protein DMG15_05705 [Acidobacteriota bacterium]